MSVPLKHIKDHSAGFQLWSYGADGSWVKLKLTRPQPKAKGKTHKKFNWWFSWSCTGQRLTHCRDEQLLQEHNPKIYEWVVTICRQVWPRVEGRSGMSS